MSLNVETYQHAKKNCNNSGSGGISQDIIDRIDKLENSQNHLYNEFIEDFKTISYIDEYRTTAIITTDGLVAKQFRNNIKELLNDDSMIDWSNTHDLIIENGYAKVAYNNLNSAVLVTKYFETPNMIGFKFDFTEKNFRVPAAGEKRDISPIDRTWLVSGVDNSGRLWILDSECKSNLLNIQVFLTIYDKDLNIVRERSVIEGLDLELGMEYQYRNTHSLSLTGEISFDEVNNAAILFGFDPSTNLYVQDTDRDNLVVICSLFSINKDGCNPRHLYTRLWNYVHYLGRGRGATTCMSYKPIFSGDKIIMQWPRSAFGSAGDTYANSWENETTDIYRYDIVNRSIERTGGASTGTRNSVYHNNAYYRLQPGPSYFYNDKKKGSIIEFFCGSIHSGNHMPYGFYKKESNYKDVNGIITDKEYILKTDTTNLSKMGYGYYSGRINNFVYSEKDKCLYFFTPTSQLDILTSINFSKYKINDDDTMTFVSTKFIELNTVHSALSYQADSNCKIMEINGDFHILFLGKDENKGSISLKYVCIDRLGDIKIAPTLIHCGNRTNADVYRYNIHQVGNKTVFVYNEAGMSSCTDTSGVKMAILELSNTSIQYEYFDEDKAVWKSVAPNKNVELSKPINRIKLKAKLNSPTGAYSPELHHIELQYWSNENDSVNRSEFYSKRIPGIANSGRAVLTSSQEINDGTIKYFVSYNGGESFAEVVIGQEFNYNVIEAPDFRVKIEMNVKNGSDNPPKVTEYSITSNHVVMHSDLERVQINLMKTNFKIDTFTKASTNGMNKMVIETFNDTKIINIAKSDFSHSIAIGEISGNYIQTNPIKTSGVIKYILLTSDEVLNTQNPNCKVEYFISSDKGKSFTAIEKDIKTKVKTTNTTDDYIEIRAVMYEDAKISAIGWAWD